VRGRLQHVEQQLHDERTAAARANESLAATRSEWEGLRAALESDLAASREREDATAQARYALEEALSRARDDAQQARDETAARLREELAALQTEADAAAAGRDEAQDRVSTLTSALELARHDLDALRLEREGIGSAAEELRAARDEAYRQLDAAHAERDEARRVAEAVGRDRDNLRSDLDNLRQQFESLDSELRDLRALHAGERDGLSADLERLQRELESVRTDRDDLQQKFGTLSSALEAERQRAEDRDHLAAALDAARNEIRHTDAAHHAEREGWERTRGGLEQEVRQARADHDNDRSAWTRLREESEALAREASGLRDGLRRAEAALETARADYAALAATLADERTRSASTRDEIDNVRRALADAEARGTDREATLTRAVRAAEAGLAQQTSAYESRLIELEAELRKADERLAEATSRAEATRTELRAGYTRAWESHARLVATDIFGYAVTTQSGDLLRCNDAFARMFGHVNAAELLARTAGRPFQPLANRQDVLARLNSTGRIDHLESCVERADGHAMRLTESLVLAGSDDHPDSRVIEHVVIATPAGPSAEELQRRRLQEVGALAAAMTPELETLATKVAARGDELRRDLTAGRLPGAQAFDDLHSSVLRLGSLVRQLSGFSRRQAREAETVELGTALTRAEGMLSRLAGDFVSFSTRQVPTPPVHVQASDLEQLLTSLVTTGRDLLPRGGALSVEVAQNEGGTAPDAGPFNMPGAALSVHASGYGVKWPDSTASLEDIARRCGGHLRVQGEAGRDVRLDVIFPRCGN
jgi:signal transduction histidine kinase